MNAYLWFHVFISLIGILAGVVVAIYLLKGARCPKWTGCFLISTLVTCVTGFFFPFHGFTPAIGVGIVVTIAVLSAGFAYYARDLAEKWRTVYTVAPDVQPLNYKYNTNT